MPWANNNFKNIFHKKKLNCVTKNKPSGKELKDIELEKGIKEINNYLKTPEFNLNG